MAKVSILVPLYGAERYIGQCARSLFAQSYKECEFIFVDDASKDRGLERLKVAVREFPRLRSKITIVELEQNGGVAAARNRAIESATGDYILFVDADDWIEPECVELLVQCAEGCSADICNAWCCNVDKNDRYTPTPERWIGSKEYHLRAVLAQSHIVPNHIRGMLFRRSLFTENALRFTPKVDFGEDYSLLPQIIYYAKKMTTLPKVLYMYRTENEGSYMNNISQRQIESYVQAQSIVSLFIESLPEAKSYAKALEMGRLNIKKWIFKRGAEPKPYNKALWGTESPKLRSPLLRLYNYAIDSQSAWRVKLLSVVVNLPLFIRKRF